MNLEETQKRYKGNADRPIEQASEDEFEISPYVEGLGDFTLDCETPLTIAVQGAWGSSVWISAAWRKRRETNT